MKILVLVLVCLQFSEGMVGHSHYCEFNHSKSSTFSVNGQTYTLSYGSGSLSMVLEYDTVTAQNIVTDNHEFGLSENEPSYPFYYSNFDGIMEMAYPSLVVGGNPAAKHAAVGQADPTFLQLLLLLTATFSVWWRAYHGRRGRSALFGEIVRTPVTWELYWQIAIQEFAIMIRPLVGVLKAARP
ncbi:unnamed protein product, partial [Rangifer tarandus platyrhynchus]